MKVEVLTTEELEFVNNLMKLNNDIILWFEQEGFRQSLDVSEKTLIDAKKLGGRYIKIDYLFQNISYFADEFKISSLDLEELMSDDIEHIQLKNKEDINNALKFITTAEIDDSETTSKINTSLYDTYNKEFLTVTESCYGWESSFFDIENNFE